MNCRKRAFFSIKICIFEIKYIILQSNFILITFKNSLPIEKTIPKKIKKVYE